MRIHRLKADDEADAIRAIHKLKPASERDGLDASPEHMRRLLEDDANYLIVATGPDDGPVGFLIAYRVPRVDRDQNMIYLYEIVVRPDCRRQGIGSQMIDLLKHESSPDDIMEIWVGTELGNTPARRLYESTGGKPGSDQIVEFFYKVQERGPNQEIHRTQ